ncbi:MAG: hypothetical protein V3T09_06380 [bacterium]
MNIFSELSQFIDFIRTCPDENQDAEISLQSFFYHRNIENDEYFFRVLTKID